MGPDFSACRDWPRFSSFTEEIMRERPPRQLTAMLARLGLAGEKDVARVGGRVRRLARDLPRFDSVWVDALAQARVLTPFQAAEINAGRGERLRIGPYLLCAREPWPPYAACYRARRVESGEIVRLVVVDNAGRQAGQILRALETLAEVARSGLPAGEECGLRSKNLAPITGAGTDEDRIWAAAPWIEGRTAAQWLVHNGRLPPDLVLEIARNMVAGLVDLERAGLCHGDVSTAGLVLQGDGTPVLLQPGLRAILRPEEGYAHGDLLPEAYDYLAPERITDGTPPSTAADVYACGCVWWHMLCGRAPLAGGNTLAKLRAAQAAEIVDVRQWVPEVPDPLSGAIAACVQREPSRRPESMARLAAMLGSPTRCGKRALAKCLAESGRQAARWPLAAPVRAKWAAWSRRLAAVVVCLMMAVAILWPWWRAGVRGRANRQDAAVRSTARYAAGENPRRDSAEPSAVPPPGNPGMIGQDREVPAARVFDGAVVPAHHEADASPSETAPTDLVLAAGGPLSIESLPLQAGQSVCGMPGERPLVMVPPAGLPVEAEDVRFENIDFLWNHRTGAEGTTASGAAIIDLRAGRAEFRGCSFRSAHADVMPPAAIRWTHPAEADESMLSLPSGRVRLARCVFYGMAAAVDCRTVGALAVEISNTLALGGGPLVRLDHGPRQDEPVWISLAQVTLRDGGPLLECRLGRIGPRSGAISIRSVGCAFVPRSDSALILFDGPQSPEPWLHAIRWTGQDSLVSPEATIAAWRGGDGLRTVLDDASISISGLVRSEVGFAGDAQSGPAASRIIRWQAPLQSTGPPGVDPAGLPTPDPPFDKPPR